MGQAAINRVFDIGVSQASVLARQKKNILQDVFNKQAPQSQFESQHDSLQQALSELSALRQALTRSQESLTSAREDARLLAEANATLKRKLTKLSKKIAQVSQIAYYDELTGLPNRSLLLDRLKQAMLHAMRQHNEVGLLLLDLDGFKAINDRLGHIAGDVLLNQVAKRLLRCIRGTDTACRYGGDEFVVLLPEIDNQENAVTVSEKLRECLSEPYIIDGEAVKVTASIGVAICRTGGKNYKELIRQADIAMYQAKARKNGSRTMSAMALATTEFQTLS